MSLSSPNAVTQPIARPITVTATGNANSGVATFTWEHIATSQTWVGTLSCPVAPYFATFTVFNYADQIGFFRAGNAFGPFFVPAGGQLSVQATGLIAGQQYTMFFVGYVSTETEVPPVFPNAYADTIVATNQGGYSQVNGSLATATGLGVVVLLPSTAVPAGYVVRIHSVTFYATAVATAPVVLVLGAGFPLGVAVAGVLTGGLLTQTIYLGGLACTSGQVSFNIEVVSGTNSNTYTCIVNYDLALL